MAHPLCGWDSATYTTDEFEIEIMFCKTHNYPAMRYEDDSVSCWWEDIVKKETDEHELIPLAWA